MAEPKKIGLLVGREWSFPPAFLEEVNSRDAGVVAEYVKLGGTVMNEPCPYAVLVDRISHDIAYYRAYMKNALLQGTYCINNPFWWSADDKFFGASLLTALQLPSPKTAALPLHSYPEGIVSESLRNLVYPLNWDALIDYVGLPAILKDAWGKWPKIYRVSSRDELVQAYDETGMHGMILQEYIEWDHFIRCLCIGQDLIMPIAYDPTTRRYDVAQEALTPELTEQVISTAQQINRTLGYDMNSIEFAIKNGIPYAIDFMNPAPDFDINHITPHYFEWAVKAMADFCIEMAHNPKPQRVEQRWSRWVEQR